MQTSLSVNLLTKVFVIRDHDPILSKRFRDDFIVFHATCFFIHGENFMLLPAQPVCYRRSCSFIYKKTHLRSLFQQRQKYGVRQRL